MHTLSRGNFPIDYCICISYTVLMVRKVKYYRWSSKIDRETLPALQAIAAGLDFLVTTPGGKEGQPSPPDLLDALAACYLAAPDDTLAALAALLAAHDLLPVTPPDAPDA